MGKKFISVTLDLDEEIFKILERVSAKRGSSVSRVAHELISKALDELTQSREDVLSIVEEAIRAMGPDKGHLLDELLALTGKEATQEKQQPVDESFDEVQMARLVMRAGTEVFGSDQGFLQWLSYPVLALGDRTPLSLLSSPAGLRMVIDVLGRIEHGVPS
jgi:uncharacterized protein (DUF2384 family)